MSYQALLPFDTDDSEFVRGFEAGRLWEQLKTGEPFDQIIHATNAEMFLRMAEATGTKFQADTLDDTWMEITVA